MSKNSTAATLAAAIEASPLTQREIAERAGFNNPNILSMLKSGETRVPLDRIPALAQALDICEKNFLMRAIEEYHPNVYRVLVDVLGLPLNNDELEILSMFRIWRQARRFD